jgi:SCY1-like protein 1
MIDTAADEEPMAHDEDEDPWGAPAVSKPTTATSYDDKGEPDFAGWLAAQSKGNKTTKNPLPKGMAKPSSTTSTKSARPIVGGRASTTGSATTTRKVVVAPKKEVKKDEPKVKEEEEEGWGDAW